ncbi:MAG TPA: hypothetical protein P5081_17715 [Phycisphaerae bacterium]|nr:hypothetical protein [Phycisphaerae bacterium]HRW54709.1 hypothetical protein [Phycisphaerae bacterium]
MIVQSLLLIAFPFTIANGEDAPDLRQLIERSRHEATLTADRLRGPGADWLLQRARTSEFTIVGESHGNQETCRFTSWLLRELKGAGYSAYVTETGPCSTALVAETARQSGFEGVSGLIRRTPFSIAFIHLRDEAQLLADAVKLDYACWGIDQEFTGSPRLLLGQLVSQAKSDDAKVIARSALDRANTGFAHFAKTGSKAKAFLSTATPADWKALSTAFATEDESLRDMIDALRASQRIYGLYFRGMYYESNHERVRLMKQTLARNFRDGANPRAVIKIGGAHAGRGYSPFDQLDVGNHIAELAAARGGDSLHICVMARRSVDRDGKATEHDKASNPIRALLDAAPETGACVFDLTALRPLLSQPPARETHADLHDLAFRFDAILLLPEFHEAESLIPMPAKRAAK